MSRASANPRRLPATWIVMLVAVVLAIAGGAARVRGQMPPAAGGGMPGAAQMAGIPMPMGDVPVGTVVVRVVRGELANVVAGLAVELQVGDRVLSAKTDATGRAQFSGLAKGLNARASASVDGETLLSRGFVIPADAGTRVMLVATPTGAPATAAGGPQTAGAASGPLSFGGQSRIQIETNDDSLEVFYLLDVVNRGSGAVSPATELVFRLPEGAAQGSLLEGSSTQAQVRGDVVSISGPFAPGSTPVQLAYTLPPAGTERAIRQRFPLGFDQVQVLVARTGALQLSSPQVSSQTEANGGNAPLMVATGPALPANTELTLTLTGLPVRSRAWRVVAVGLVALIIVVGAMAAFTGGAGAGASARRSELEARRERLLDDLVKVETQLAGRAAPDVRLAGRRSDLVAQLERVYGELDAPGGANSGGEGLVA
jgi:hypothetical protein